MQRPAEFATILSKSRLVFVSLFYIFIILVTYRNLPSVDLKAHPVLLKSLFSGSTQGYLIPASELEPFKKYLPKRGKITLLTDQPFSGNPDEEKFLYDAQNYLVPLLLDYEPEQDIGILYCSNETIAEKRLRETGYTWSLKLSEGKGTIARKKS